MAEIMQSESGKRRGKKRRSVRAVGRIDMTPMVDLAALLLTFFMLTTAFTKFNVMEVSFPAEKGQPTPWPKGTMTVLIDAPKEKIYYYFGKFEDVSRLKSVSLSSTGFRKLLFERNNQVNDQVKTLQGEFKNGRLSEDALKDRIDALYADHTKAFPVIIKTGEKATYETVVDVIDELNITNVKQYAIADMSKAETELLRREDLTAQK
jgi:biopolymer transport protein ExbD